MKKQRNTFQTKEQDKTSETDLNEMEISNWPDRVQNNGHKDAQWSQENNARTSENFNRETEYIRKYQTDLVQAKAILMRSNWWRDNRESRLDGLAK